MILISVLAIIGWLLYLLSNKARIKEYSERAFYNSLMRTETTTLLSERNELREIVANLEKSAAEQKGEMVDILRKHLALQNEYAWYRIMVRKTYADEGLAVAAKIRQQKAVHSVSSV